MPPLLLTWTDRLPLRRAGHHGDRPEADVGPVLRMLEHAPVRYTDVWVLATEETRASTAALCDAIRSRGATPHLCVVAVPDPSDYEALFSALRPVLGELPAGAVDVLLSAGTPQAQVVWVLLVKAELLRARMWKVIPAAFVPSPHPAPVVEVRLDFAGFPEIRALREEVGRLRTRANAHGLVGESEPIQRLRRLIDAVARSDVPTIVVGETGVGKELVARAIHDAGPRAARAFVAENCGAFSEGVLQSELFGHERGAFTGAVGQRRGLFEQAHQGTLFLDEIGELPLSTQANLLRVLQDGTLRRVGAERSIQVDVRLIAATHRDLPALVREGKFREDLYYRLRGAVLTVPPLRDRPGDIELLVERFLAGSPLTPTPAAWRTLRSWRWPGNVRELRAEVMRWTVFCRDRVGVDDLAPEIAGTTPIAAHPADDAPRTLAQVVEAAEQDAIRAALERHAGNLSATARALDIDRNTLKRKLRHG